MANFRFFGNRPKLLLLISVVLFFIAIFVLGGFGRPPFYFLQENKTNAAGPPIQVYYSFGQNTNDHKTCLDGNCVANPLRVTIGSGIATFTAAQTAPNIGVGDKVTYTGGSAFISAKISQTQWRVINKTGGSVANVSNVTVSSIKHAFASFAGAINGSVDSSHLGTSDLISGNYILNLAAYFDSGPDTAPVYIASWTTGASNYIRVYTPTDTSGEVNQSQRHSGKWDTSKYRLEVTGNNTAITNFSTSIHIEGLQILITTSTDANAISFSSVPGGGEAIISSNIIRAQLSGGAHDLLGINVEDLYNGAKVKIFNNIIYDFINGSNYIYGMRLNTFGGNTGKLYASNNTVQNSRIAYSNSGVGEFVAKNNVAQDSGNKGFDGSFGAASAYNLSDKNDAPGGNAKNTNNVKFVSELAGDKDLHLRLDDTEARNTGTDLSADPNLSFTTDIDGQTRPAGGWDRGADDYFAPPASPGNTSKWAWSDDIGWISFSSVTGGGAGHSVNISSSTGDLSGDAWSDNIGWISFDRSKTGNPPSTPFNGGSGPIAQFNTANAEISGWMRALSVCDSVPCASYSGGWDGWIRLCDRSMANCSGDNQIVKAINGDWYGWAWSDLVTGWISFNCFNGGNCATQDYKVIFNVAPTKPTDLGGGTFRYCFGESPDSIILSWKFNDTFDDSQSAYQVQISKNGGADTYDSGPIMSSSASITADFINQQKGYQFIWYDPAGEDDQNYTWRVMTWDSRGVISPWSSWANFTVPAGEYPDGTITIDKASPSVNELVTLSNEPTIDNASWQWTITPAVSYENGTNDTSQHPQIIFPQSGDYVINLTVTNLDNDCFCNSELTVRVKEGLPSWQEKSP